MSLWYIPNNDVKRDYFFFTLLQIVCVPFEWRVKLFLIVLVNAAVSVLVEVRHTHTLTHKETKIGCFSFFSCLVLVVCLLFCLFFFQCSMLMFVSLSLTAGNSCGF